MHLFGNVVDIDKIRSVIPGRVKIIEDACQAVGSSINGKSAGSMGDLAAFSFYPTKNLGGYGDGGMVVTGDAEIAKKIRLLKMYGMQDYDHICINGVNSRLDEIQAAILRIKLRYLETYNAKRNVIAKRYIESINPNKMIPQKIEDSIISNYHVFECRTTSNRNELIRYLEKNNIQSNVYYLMPIHLQEANKYLGYKLGSLPNAEKLSTEVVAIPMYPELKEDEQTYIIEKINEFL